MGVAIRKHPGKTHRVSLLEQQQTFTKPLRVDYDNGIIPNILVQGFQSKNNRRYDPQACKRAVEKGMYDVKVFMNHPPRDDPGRERDGEEAFGRLANAHWTPEGVFADLHFLRSHKLAESVCEDVSRGLAIWGASINGDGDQRLQPDGSSVITEITKIRSVDLVTRPATTTSLSESDRSEDRRKAVATIKFGQLLESFSLDKRLPGRQRRNCALMAEKGASAFNKKSKAALREAANEGVDGFGTSKDNMGKGVAGPPIKHPELEAEMDAPPGMEDGGMAAEGVDHNAALENGLHTACHHLLDEAKEAGWSEDELLKRMRELIKAKGKLLGTAVEEEEMDTGDMEPPEDEGVTESHRLKCENNALRLLMESGIYNADPVFVKALSLLESDEERKLLVEREKYSSRSTQVRSQSPTAHRTGVRVGATEQKRDWVTKN